MNPANLSFKNLFILLLIIVTVLSVHNYLILQRQMAQILLQEQLRTGHSSQNPTTTASSARRNDQESKIQQQGYVSLGESSNSTSGSTERVAYVITVTHYKKNHPFQDGAAVLAKSIQLNHRGPEYDLVAIIHEGAASLAPIYEKFGYICRIVKTPIDVKNIRNKVFVHFMKKLGCCGEKEFIKLEIYRLTQYSRTFLMDSDMLLLNPLTNVLQQDKELVFIYDWSLLQDHMKMPCVQGAFMAVKPSLQTFNDIVDVIVQGDFRPNTGWRGSRIGWCWGGPQIQGIMAYYINYMALPNTTMEGDGCRVNGMAISKNRKGEDCSRIDKDTVQLFHYTHCEKPWSCLTSNFQSSQIPLCKQMHQLWWQYRNYVEEDYNLPVTTRQAVCADNSYDSIPFPGLDALVKELSPVADILSKKLTNRIAYVVTITHFVSGHQYQDGAAVLAKSIALNHRGPAYDLVAILHDQVQELTPLFEKVGYKVLIMDNPVDIKTIKNQEYVKLMKTYGCCGENEFIKLYAFQMLEYQKVVILDCDMLLLRPITQILEMKQDIAFVYDYPSYRDHADKPNIQTAFVVIKPSLKVFDQLIDVIKEADFRPGSGWYGSQIGLSWGGAGLPGLLSYYINHLAPSNSSAEVDGCRVNTMAIGKNKLDEFCDRMPSQSVNLFHFTYCGEPWDCKVNKRKSSELQLCNEMHNAWWKYRNFVERDFRSPPSNRVEICQDNVYDPIQFPLN